MRWLYTFRSLTDEELNEYLSFSETDAGRWFVATQRKGLLDAMRTAMDAAAPAQETLVDQYSLAIPIRISLLVLPPLG